MQMSVDGARYICNVWDFVEILKKNFEVLNDITYWKYIYKNIRTQIGKFNFIFIIYICIMQNIFFYLILFTLQSLNLRRIM